MGTTTEQRARSGALRPEQQPLRVLFIAREGEDIEYLVAELRRTRFVPQVELAADAARARVLLRRDRMEAVLHLAQPGLPSLGWVLREVAEVEPAPPVISVVADDEQGAQAMAAGADHYVTRAHLGCLGPTLRYVLRTRQEIHRREQALRESVARYRTLVEDLDAWVWELDTETRYTYASPHVREMLGYDPQEIIGKTPLELMPPVEARRVAEIVVPLLARHERLPPLENTMRCRDGRLVTVETVGRPILEDGRFVGYRGINRDITARKRTEEALRESEANYRAIFDGANDALLVLDDHTGRILDANRRAERMFGYGRQALTRVEIEHFLPPELPSAKEQAREWIARARQDGPQLVEWRACNRKGERFWAEVSLKRVTLGGRRRILAAVRDISARKQEQEALERERAFLKSAFDILPFPMGILGLDGERIRVNAATYEFFGPSPVDETRVQLLDADTRTPVPRAQWPLARALAGETVKGVEGVITTPNGRLVPILTYAAPVRVGERQVAVVWSIQDISALKEADRAKDEFLAVLSHELLTPLANIVGWTQAARRTPELWPQALEVIERNIARQRRVLDDLVVVSRILHGKLFISLQPTDLWHLAEQSVEDIRPDAAERQLTLVLEPPTDALPVLADPPRIRQVIGNLLANALKFTDPGGTITVRGWAEPEWALVSVSDTGRGIPPEVIPTLFRPFRQFMRTERTGGLGLGLSLVRGIVELHHGWVHAESPGEGRGSTFTIALPRTDRVLPPE